MTVNFEKDYLKELYVSGNCSDKKHRFQPDIIKRYKKCIDYLKVAKNKEALYPIVSLNFEALGGDKEGLFSIRVNRKYRIEFTMEEIDDSSKLTICNIIELSNHYK